MNSSNMHDNSDFIVDTTQDSEIQNTTSNLDEIKLMSDSDDDDSDCEDHGLYFFLVIICTLFVLFNYFNKKIIKN